MNEQKLKRQLNWFDATMIVSVAMIGIGIFLGPSESAKFLTSSSQLIFLFGVGGVIVFLSGFVFAELGAMFPRSGGEYVYLEEAFGPTTGFLYGWTMMTTTQSGSIALVAFGCAQYINFFIPMSDIAILVLALEVIWALTLANILGVKIGSTVQNITTVLKILALAAIIIYGIFIYQGPEANIGSIIDGNNFDISTLSKFGLALIAILFSFGGIHNLNFIAGEVKKPSLNLPLAIIAGVIIVAVLYLLINVVYAKGLSIHEMADSKAIASDTMSIIAGNAGTIFVSIAIIISTFGITNVMIMSGARVIYAVSEEQEIIKSASKLSQKFSAPYIALIAQSLWTTILLFTNSFGELLNYVVFGDAIFFVMITFALIRLRKTRPDMDRPFKIWAYPVLPVFLIFIFSIITLNVFVNNFNKSLVGLLIILSGIPVYYFAKKKK